MNYTLLRDKHYFDLIRIWPKFGYSSFFMTQKSLNETDCWKTFKSQILKHWYWINYFVLDCSYQNFGIIFLKIIVKKWVSGLFDSTLLQTQFFQRVYNKAKQKKLLVSVWVPVWDFFSDNAAGNFFSKQQVN